MSTPRSEITITPTATEYGRLCRDLEVLREAGAASNTAAILEAVHRAAKDTRTGYDGASNRMLPQRANAREPEPRR